jgi:hypothetical protein
VALLLRNDALFLHVPKTGGTWVTAVLRDLGLVRCRVVSKHADMEHVRHCARLQPGRYLEACAKAGPRWQRRVRRGWKFCFVRHPLSWYESYWLFMRARGWNAWGVNRRGRPRWHPNAGLDGLGDDDFNLFVRRVLERRPGYVTRLFGQYATADVGFVGRQERLADDLLGVLRRIGAAYDETRVRAWPAVNASDLSQGRPKWDDGLRREVLRMEHDAIVRFGYDSGHAIDAASV